VAGSFTSDTARGYLLSGAGSISPTTFAGFNIAQFSTTVGASSFNIGFFVNTGTTVLAQNAFDNIQFTDQNGILRTFRTANASVFRTNFSGQTQWAWNNNSGSTPFAIGGGYTVYFTF
jgi:hypothetical protein